MPTRFLLTVRFLVAVVFGTCLPIGHALATDSPSATGAAIDNAPVPNFKLLDHTGQGRELIREGGAKAVVIITQGNGCPASRNHFLVVNEMQKKYGPAGVVFWFLNANRQDDRKSVASESLQFNNKTPILLDPSQVVTETLGFSMTAEGIIINPKDWKVVYRGAVDDRYVCDVGKTVAGSPWLNQALDQFLNGQEITVKEKKSRGCLFAFSREKPKDFVQGAAKIIADRCMVCHVEGNRFGPDFSTYEKVQGWAPMIERALLSANMPPWGADLYYGKFEGGFDLTADEKRELFHWLKAGAPRGEGADPLQIAHATRMKIQNQGPQSSYRRDPKRKATPDHWFSAPSYAIIPPEGLSSNELYQIGGPTSQDFWIKLLTTELIHPHEAHHQYIIISSKSIDELKRQLKNKPAKPDPQDPQQAEKLSMNEHTLSFTGRLLQEFINDPSFVQLPTYSFSGGGTMNIGLKDIAPFVPKGSYIFLATHHLGTGAAENLKFRVGFTAQKPYSTLKKMKTLVLESRNFTIPAQTRNFEVITPSYTIPRDVNVIGFSAHMHSRGDATHVRVKLPDGKEDVIFSIPFFSSRSQRNYMLQSPMRLPKGTQIWADAVFDNSPFNPANPDATKPVTAGDGPDHEVIVMTITYAEST